MESNISYVKAVENGYLSPNIEFIIRWHKTFRKSYAWILEDSNLFPKSVKVKEVKLKKVKKKIFKYERQGEFNFLAEKNVEPLWLNQKASTEIDFKYDALKPDGNLTMGGISPEKIEKGTKIISKFIKLGVYKFSDIIEDVYDILGDKLKDIFDALKSAYSTYYNTEATDEEAEKMDANIRQFTFENVAKKFDNVYNRPRDSQQNSGNAGNDVSSNEENVSGNGIPSTENGKGAAEANSKNSGRPSGSVNSSLFAPPVGESGDNELHQPVRGTQPAQHNAGVIDGRGNSVDGTNGIYAGRPTNDGPNQSAETTTGSLFNSLFKRRKARFIGFAKRKFASIEKEVTKSSTG
jgi:hypothetical protein